MKKLHLITIALSLYFINFAQFQSPKYLPNYDNRVVHWGFTFGVNKFDFIMLKTQSFNFADSIDNLYGITHKWLPGGHLGPIMEIRLGRYFKFRTLITLTFQQRTLVYHFDHGKQVVEIPIASTLLQTPFLLKFHGARSTNIRPYVITGFAPTYDIAAMKRPQTDQPKVFLNTLDFTAEIGSGIEWFLPYFKLSTELKFGRGFINLLVPDNTVYTKYIQGLNSYYFMISLHFEG